MKNKIDLVHLNALHAVPCTHVPHEAEEEVVSSICSFLL
jgi:hypothetical protein